MKVHSKWLRLLVVLLPIGWTASCMTDFNDAALTGVYDYVSTSVTDGLSSMVIPVGIIGWL